MGFQMTIGKKLALCFAAMLLVSGALSMSSWLSAGKLGALLDTAANRTARKQHLCGRMGKLVAEMESLETELVLSSAVESGRGVQRYQREFNGKLAEMEGNQKEMTALVVTDTGRQLVAALAASLAWWRAAHEAVFNGRGDRSTLARDVAGKLQPEQAAAQDAVERLTQRQAALNQAAAADAAGTMTTAYWIDFLLICASLAVGGVGLLVVRQITGALRRVVSEMADGAEQVASAALEVSSASQSLAQGASNRRRLSKKRLRQAKRSTP